MTTTIPRAAWHTDLAALSPCADALAWTEGCYPTLADAWRACERGDWMLWLAGRLSGPTESASRKQLVLAACACAREALPFVRAREDRPRKAIETAESWARGEPGVTLADVRNAAADAAYADAARKTMLKKCADIMRQHYPEPPEFSRSSRSPKAET